LPDGLTERQREKELAKQAALFERAVESGSYLDGETITFGEFAQQWMSDYAENSLRRRRFTGMDGFSKCVLSQLWGISDWPGCNRRI
jgi:hypothetical protein